MLYSAATEKVSALNLKRSKADNKTCGQSPKSHSRQGMAFLRAEGGSIPQKITGHTLQAAQDDDTIPFTENKSVRSRRSHRPVMTRRQRFRVR